MRSRKPNLETTRAFSFAIFFALLLSVSMASAGSDTYQDNALKIPALKREVDDLESGIKHLIEEKRETDDDAQVASMTIEIAEKYKKLKEVGEKLEAVTTLVRFKFPEQAEKLDRQYVRFKTKSLADLESEVGIDGRLDRIKTKVLATFPVPDPNAGKKVEPKINPFFIRQPASVVDEADVPEKITLKK